MSTGRSVLKSTNRCTVVMDVDGKLKAVKATETVDLLIIFIPIFSEQQYRLHRLLAYDPHNECRGIFSDWFRFPSCCICKCYNIPFEYRVTSRSPRSMSKNFKNDENLYNSNERMDHDTNDEDFDGEEHENDDWFQKGYFQDDIGNEGI